MNNTNAFSVKEIAQKLNCSSTDAYGLVKFLQSQKIVVLAGTRKESIGRGKPTNLYALSSENAPMDMISLINKIF